MTLIKFTCLGQRSSLLAANTYGGRVDATALSPTNEGDAAIETAGSYRGPKYNTGQNFGRVVFES